MNNQPGNTAAWWKNAIRDPDPLILSVAVVLLLSGAVHLILLLVTGANWEGPLSLRKPGLFGISTGLTAWSLAWVLTKLVPHSLDRRFSQVMSSAMLIEVVLITTQYWRGVPSHFNHATSLDSAIEYVMLGAILTVTVGIIWLTWRSKSLLNVSPAMATAIRAGMGLLTISCGLGVLAMIAGEVNLAAGRPPEVWGRAGVIKFPHGAALHAIQLLPFLAWSLSSLDAKQARWLVRSAVGSQFLFLAQAMWQTVQGRSRFDLDFTGAALVLGASLLLTVPVIAILQSVQMRWNESRRTR